MAKEKPVTAAMIKSFGQVRDKKLGVVQAARDLGMAQSSFSRKYDKWQGQQMSAPPVAATHKKQATGLGGISLKGLRTASKKPQDSVRTRFYELEQGMAYKVEDLCREWNVQPNTLIRHAKDVGAFIYAEVGPENWVPVIIRPKQ